MVSAEAVAVADSAPAKIPVFANPLEEAEYKALVHALNVNGGHRERTAEALGVSRRTLQYKLKRFGLVRQYQNN
jgi:two-component system NtrC family response regulator